MRQFLFSERNFLRCNIFVLLGYIEAIENQGDGVEIQNHIKRCKRHQ
jgi:hypothetical protein